MTSTTNLYEFVPDYAIAPGLTLEDVLRDRRMPQAELARRTNRPLKTISEIVSGIAQITPETAIQFEHVLGIPASFWLNLESNYREALARIKERKTLEGYIEMLRKFPVKELVRLGWIPKVQNPVGQLQTLLDYFGVSSLDMVDNVYSKVKVACGQSKAYNVDMYAIYSWLRKGEKEAQGIDCKPFDARVFKANLLRIKSLIGKKPEEMTAKMKECCAEAGVALVCVPEIKGCRACGVSGWLGKDKALIMLSLRHKTDDHLWFTFYHEAGHILLHNKRETYVDIDNSKEDAKIELEANRFASNFLINPNEYLKFVCANDFSRSHIVQFASRQQVSPGIILGRLQHDDYLPFNTSLNHLKVHYIWEDV
ncbi:MAG: ImmA/IrrE family metallo-endopeptidase [Ignavibacteriales bacterium]